MIDLAMNLNDECMLCGQMFERDTLVSITPGEFLVGEKSGRLLFRAEGYPINCFHLHCFQERCNSMRFQLKFVDTDGRCGICGDDLEHERNVFRVTQGFIHGSGFSPVVSTDGSILCLELCLECILSHVGEGDTEVGEMYLGLELDQ